MSHAAFLRLHFRSGCASAARACGCFPYDKELSRVEMSVYFAWAKATVLPVSFGLHITFSTSSLKESRHVAELLPFMAFYMALEIRPHCREVLKPFPLTFTPLVHLERTISPALHDVGLWNYTRFPGITQKQKKTNSFCQELEPMKPSLQGRSQ